MAKLISLTYGEALFEVALEKNTLNETFEEIKLVKEALGSNKEFIRFLNHPKIPKKEKIQVIENIFQGKVSDDVTGFLVIIVEKERYDKIDEILDYFIAKVMEYKKIGVAKITTALELTKEQEEKLLKKLLDTTKYIQFEINYKVDPSIIGGIIIQIGDRVVDGSIKTKLAHFVKKLKKIQLSDI